MKRFLKLPIDKVLNTDLKQSWKVNPIMSFNLNDDIIFDEDGKEALISYDTLDLQQPHTYHYISLETGKVEQYTMTAGVYGRPPFYDANTMIEITEQEFQDMLAGYEDYQIGKAYNAGDKFKYNEKVYFVIQLHTSQIDWLPDIVKALYREIPPANLITEWKQPLGSHDAYQINAKVNHKNKLWISTANNNIWEPGVYGWNEL